MPQVLVLGDAILDCYLNGSADRLCPEAPVPVVTIAQRQDSPGGAANTAVNVASLGGTVQLLSVIGQDGEGDRLQKSLQQHQVATEHLLISSQRSTLAKQRVVAGSQLVVRFDQGSTEAIGPDLERQLCDRLTDQFPQCDAAIVSDYGYGILTPVVIQTLTLLQFQFPKTLVIDSKHLGDFRSVQPTAVKPNYSQAIQLLGLPQQTSDRATQIEPFGERLLNLTRAQIVAVTLDAEGAIVFERGQPPLRSAADPVPSNQTSGAGDTYVSALALALATGLPTSKAAIAAAAATAIVVQQPGTSIVGEQTQPYDSLAALFHRPVS